MYAYNIEYITPNKLQLCSTEKQTKECDDTVWTIGVKYIVPEHK